MEDDDDDDEGGGGSDNSDDEMDVDEPPSSPKSEGPRGTRFSARNAAKVGVSSISSLCLPMLMTRCFAEGSQIQGRYRR